MGVRKPGEEFGGHIIQAEDIGQLHQIGSNRSGAKESDSAKILSQAGRIFRWIVCEMKVKEESRMTVF